MNFDFKMFKKFLEDIKDYKLINGKVINNVDGFSDIIDSYGLILENYFKINGFNDIWGNFTNYVREIEIEGYYSYKLCWNIDDILQSLKRNNYPVVNLLIPEIIESVDFNNIDFNYAAKVSSKNNNPIIVIRLPQLYPRDIIIDGNHRAVWSYKNNKDFISAYYLPYDIHTPYITSGFFKLLYMIECNISLYMAYISGIDDRYKEFLFKL